MFIFLHLFLLTLGATTTTSAAAAGGRVSAVIVFGDSSVDAGNNNAIRTVLKSNFRPYGRDFMGGRPTGRFCNGRLATDFLSERFGIKPSIPAYLDPAYNISDFATGVCFASAGTGYDNATSDVLSVIPLWMELAYFKDYITKLKSHFGPMKAKETVNEALYTISVGTNDFLENYYSSYSTSRTSSRYSIGAYQDFLIHIAEKFILDIHALGARKVSLTGLLPMGCLPLERSTNAVSGKSGCVEMYNKVARDFNVKLKALAGKLRSEVRGLRIVYSPLYDKLLDAIDHPSSYGFENVEEGCCATGMFEMGYLCNSWNPFTCPDANKYVFWDAFHPTERLNSILADYFMNTTLAEFLWS
ncbi:GDSL esterase/lipase [Acorus calamus]|uniref:GDSL esterase/lipase n=1 Tax=Acorus calamus TaxID=4465 RepID=A0AAV9EV46_ACOCL|nr:GDSL esterase/lipase [Acorus calamus]